MSAHKQHCADIVHGPPLSSFVCSPFYWAVLQFDRFFPAHILLLVITFVAENRIGEKKSFTLNLKCFSPLSWYYSLIFLFVFRTLPILSSYHEKFFSERNSLVNAFYNECNMKQRERERERSCNWLIFRIQSIICLRKYTLCVCVPNSLLFTSKWRIL